jgi:hypothetical protein|tara:strand:+ start:153 stop:428 length:276 start_codon:yes stop_codon:yes gene_type:complete
MKQKSGFENSATNIISFKKFKQNKNKIVTSTIAAILAIKIEHPKNVTPEDFFINQIDSYDNIEVLAFEDALENDNIGLTTKDAQNEASNDD